MQEIVAQVLSETVDIESRPHEPAIERTWTEEHTTMYLTNVAEDIKTIRNHEFAKVILWALLVGLLIVVLCVFVFTGNKDLAEKALTHIAMLIGGGLGGYHFGQKKQ